MQHSVRRFASSVARPHASVISDRLPSMAIGTFQLIDAIFLRLQLLRIVLWCGVCLIPKKVLNWPCVATGEPD